MCRDIKILRASYTPGITEADVHAAALQYVRTVSGFRRPLAMDNEAFEWAVARITHVTHDLLAQFEIRTERHIL